MKKNIDDIEQEIKNLTSELLELEKKYYLGKSETEDQTYDFKLRKLIWFENNYPQFKQQNSPTEKINSFDSPETIKMNHNIPMLSLSNAFNQEELKKFFDSIEKIVENISYYIEPKIDGSSISLIYENNKLKHAISRGDGIKGELLTEKIKKITSIPLETPGNTKNFIVRGEIFVTKNDFEEIKQNMIKNNEKTIFANHRNYVSGTLRIKNLDSLENKKLRFLAYQLIIDDNIKTQQESIEILRKWNFPTHLSTTTFFSSNKLKIFEFLNFFKTFKETWDIPTDGAVIKVNELNLHEEIGYTSKAPKWAIAFKYPGLIKNTKLIDISTKVGKSGRITYLGQVEPIELNGTTIKFVSLHNADNIKKLNLKIGHKVQIYKSGEIIPQILGFVEQNYENLKEFEIVENCPCCSTKLVIKNEKIQFCLNENCLDKNLAKIVHFTSREAMNIEGLSEGLIKKLNSLNLLNNITDLYELKNHKETIFNNNIQVKEKLFNKLVNSIEKSKKTEQYKVLYALGIEHLGQQNSKLLLKHFANIESLFLADLEEIINIDGIGNICAREIYTWKNHEKNQIIIEKLKQLNIIRHEEIKIKTLESIFLNKNIVISGTFTFSRNTMEEKLENIYDAKIKKTVSKNIDYLILGENPGKKYDEAKVLNIKIITEQELKKIINI